MAGSQNKRIFAARDPMIHYSPHEDRLNAWSHAIGILLAVMAGGYLLLRCLRAEDSWAVTGMVLYLFGLTACYVTSTVYHSFPSGHSTRETLRRWDHAAIYWHIAGSYSPITLVALRTASMWGWGLLAFVWTAAIIGTITSFRHLREHSHVETTCFVLMGLSGLVAFRTLMHCLPPAATVWLIAEGVAYVTGAVIYARSPGRKYVHTLFHLFVLLGTICHLMCLYYMFDMYLPNT